VKEFEATGSCPSDLANKTERRRRGRGKPAKATIWGKTDEFRGGVEFDR